MSKLVKTDSIKVIKDKKYRKGYWERQFGTDYEIGDISEGNKDMLKSLVKGISVGRMLDNGCGAGRIKKFYEDLGWNVFGIDISENAIVRASSITPVNLVCSIAEDIPFKDDFFDVVLSWRVLHSLYKPDRILALQEIDRVLKPSGYFIYSVQSALDKVLMHEYKKYGVEHPEDSMSYVVDMDVGGRIEQRLKHFYTKEKLVSEIEKNTNIKVIKIEQYKEQSGWSDKIQQYWTVKGRKIS